MQRTASAQQPDPPVLTVRSVSRRIPLDEPAAELRAAQKALKMPDALILATVDLHVDLALTGDERWLKVSGLTYKLQYVGSDA